jgi:diguanylate cyclase (GGDEF)-like protein/PAS domain S-box-containing protein
MTRQVHELAAEGKGVLGHITSLKPLRPENAPDAWERRALLTFEAGAKEALSLERMAGGPYLRFMRPLPVEAPCLKCHEAQGYKVGDVRGGISVAVPFAPFNEIAESNQRTLLLGHGLIGALGLAGLWVGGRRLLHSESALLQSLDVAERMAAQEQLLLSSLGEGVYGVDTAGNCIFINAYALDILGFGKDEVIGQDQHRLFHSRKEDGSPYPHEECAVYLTLRDGMKRTTEDAFLRKNGQFLPVRLTVTPMQRKGVLVGVIVAFHDISEQREADERIQHMANFDKLTDLPNRSLFHDRLAQALVQARRENHTGALLFLDLDRFKEVNDTLGHDAGDRLLKAVAGRLREQVRASDTVARLGGDEFTVILPHVEAPHDASLVADKIIASISEPFDLNGVMASVGVSIGIALFPAHGDSVEEILKASDRAMYLAKDAGRNTYRFNPEGDANLNGS